MTIWQSSADGFESKSRARSFRSVWPASRRARCSWSTTCGRRRSSARRGAGATPSGTHRSRRLRRAAAPRRPRGVRRHRRRWRCCRPAGADRAARPRGGRGARRGVLLVVQVLLGHYCPYCCVADVSGARERLVAACASGYRAARGRRRRAWLRSAGAACWSWRRPCRSSSGFRLDRHRAAGHRRRDGAAPAPGMVTVVDFVDFECPFCRMTHRSSSPSSRRTRTASASCGARCRCRCTPTRMDAARAACCAERLGKGDAMADALFTAPVEDAHARGVREGRRAAGPLARPVPRLRRRPGDRRAHRGRPGRVQGRRRLRPAHDLDRRRQLVGARSKEEIAKIVDEELAASGG